MIDETGRPLHLTWNYRRDEIVADAVIHALGNIFAVAAVTTVIAVGLVYGSGGALAASLVYAVSLLAALAVSAAYNLWPVSATKWWLRRFDHATIFLLIAGTYTPFLVRIPNPWVHIGLLGLVWTVALLGFAMKVLMPGRLDRLAILLYLALGWSGVVAIGPIIETLSPTVLWLIAAGGLLYTVGVIFHVWESLRFQNAIWHGFVLTAAVCHFAAIVFQLAMDPAAAGIVP